MATKAELQFLRSLRDKKTRDTQGLFVVEGAKVIRELLAAGQRFEAIYATEHWEGPRSHPLSPAEMARASHFPTPSSVLALARIQRPELASGALCSGLSLLLDRIQDPGNVGTLLRLADWYGIDRIVLSPDCADPFSAKVINASKASFARVRCYSAELAPLLAQTRDNKTRAPRETRESDGVPGSATSSAFGATSAEREIPPQLPILGCDLQGDSVHELPALKNAVIIIGSEGQGLSPMLRPHITQLITIPRYGAAESLNAAIAAAIICDNLRRAEKLGEPRLTP